MILSKALSLHHLLLLVLHLFSEISVFHEKPLRLLYSPEKRSTIRILQRILKTSTHSSLRQIPMMSSLMRLSLHFMLPILCLLEEVLRIQDMHHIFPISMQNRSSEILSQEAANMAAKAFLSKSRHNVKSLVCLLASNNAMKFLVYRTKLSAYLIVLVL